LAMSVCVLHPLLKGEPAGGRARLRKPSVPPQGPEEEEPAASCVAMNVSRETFTAFKTEQLIKMARTQR
jgi:hypothetical protein